MTDLIKQLLEAIDHGRQVAYCRLVETRGSTPQKAGAVMLVFADGSQAGTLGGGCVEAEVKRRALTILEKGEPEISTFQLDSDYGWDDGLICGGRMKVLIDPLNRQTSLEYFQRLGQLIGQGRGVTEAIVFDGEANNLSAPEAYLFDEDEQFVIGTNRKAKENEQVGTHLKPLESRPRPYAAHGIAYLPTLPRCRLLIVGGGHVGQAVADLAIDLDFDVWVADDREEFVSPERFPRVERRIHGPVERVLLEVDVTPNTYCLIVTRGHNHDEQALYCLAERGARYVGLIGSRRKIKMIYDDLLNEGISEDALSRVHAPVGIDIGSQSVPEIAVSICAELVSHRNRGGVVPGRPQAVTVQSG